MGHGQQRRDVVLAQGKPNKGEVPKLFPAPIHLVDTSRVSRKFHSEANKRTRENITTLMGFGTGDSSPFEEPFEPSAKELKKLTRANFAQNAPIPLVFDHFPKTFPPSGFGME